MPNTENCGIPVIKGGRATARSDQVQFLSHYTSKHGLIGIVRSQSLWATNFLALNDQIEFMYAWSSLTHDAYEKVLTTMPLDLRNPNVSIPDLISQLTSKLKAEAEVGNGYGHLYVTSFARGRNEDEDTRGILTLWDRYTKCEGFCVQFAKEDIERIIEHEKTSGSYALLELTEVTYGIDKSDLTYQDICHQVSLRLLKEIVLRTRDRRITVDWQAMWADTALITNVLRYCGCHKDPAFSDEREMRVMAYPVHAAEYRVFTGLTTPKRIYQRTATRPTKYIVIGENRLPGVTPKRILIGPKAELNFYEIQALYPSIPEISRSNIPIR